MVLEYIEGLAALSAFPELAHRRRGLAGWAKEAVAPR
jgi:hypothetical protein